MKFLRFLCNFLMFFAVTFAVSCVQVGLFDVVAAQSPDVKAIHIVPVNDTAVAYLDSYAFSFEDIKENYKQEPKYRIRNWASANWWKKGMKWADVALDATIATFKPVVVPIAQVNAVMNYHGYSINQYNSDLIKKYGNYKSANDALYQLYEVFDMGYGECHMIGSDGMSTPDLISAWETSYYERLAAGNVDVHSKDIEFYNDPSILAGESLYCQYSRWVSRNKPLYNNNWKLQKYNASVYKKYFKKFISYSEVVNEDGEVIGYTDRHIKAATTVLYYQQYVAIIVSLVFVIKFPINFVSGRYEGKDMGLKKAKK